MQIHREVPDQSRRPHQLLAAETYPLEVRPGLGGLGRDFRRDRGEGLFLREGVGLGFRKVGTEGVGGGTQSSGLVTRWGLVKSWT